MSENSKIEWTDATWNPVRGCTKVSPGCKNCYAETFAERWRGVPGHAYEQGFDLRLVPEKLDEPLRWQTPRRIFVNSMSDLFQKGVPHEFICSVYAHMARARWHTFQVLTKRAEEMLNWYMVVSSLVGAATDELMEVADRGRWPLPNVHIGVSVEDRKYGLPRIDALRRCPAALRFLSIEPLLEDLGTIDLTGIGWVIVGGESGPGARPMHPDWVRSIRDQCVAAGVPFFFKQWGAWIPGQDTASAPLSADIPPGSIPPERCCWLSPLGNRQPIGEGRATREHKLHIRVGKKRAGRMLDGRTWDEFPAVQR